MSSGNIYTLLMSSRSGAFGPLALLSLLGTLDFAPGMSSERRKAPISAPWTVRSSTDSTATYITRQRSRTIPEPLKQRRNQRPSAVPRSPFRFASVMTHSFDRMEQVVPTRTSDGAVGWSSHEMVS